MIGIMSLGQQGQFGMDDGKLPWKNPSHLDKKHFRIQVEYQITIMGLATMKGMEAHYPKGLEWLVENTSLIIDNGTYTSDQIEELAVARMHGKFKYIFVLGGKKTFIKFRKKIDMWYIFRNEYIGPADIFVGAPKGKTNYMNIFDEDKEFIIL